MPLLINFEDAYGMSDIVCLAHGINLPGLNSDKANNAIIGIQEIIKSNKQDTYICCGISCPKVLIVENKLLGDIYNYNISELVIVFDMDSPSGKGVITAEKLKEYVDGIEKQLRSFNVKVRYAPVVWSAETIALYYLLDIYNDKEKCVDITTVMHKKSTIKFHGKLIEEILNKESKYQECKVKHTRKYMNDKDKVRQVIEKFIRNYPQSINLRLLKWILTEDISYLFDSIEVVEHQRKVEDLYNEGQASKNNTFYLYGKEISLNKKCW